MKIKRVLVAILLLVLVCTLFVACNDDNGVEQLTRKPWAKPDLDNKYDDSKAYSNGDSIDTWEFQGEYILVVLTNSESLNNLFYDYEVDDFGKDKFIKIENRRSESLEKMRNQVKNDIEYDSQDTDTINPKEFTRSVKLTLKYPSRENAITYINALESLYYVLYAVPNSEIGGSWFTSLNNPHTEDSFCSGTVFLCKLNPIKMDFHLYIL